MAWGGGPPLHLQSLIAYLYRRLAGPAPQTHSDPRTAAARPILRCIFALRCQVLHAPPPPTRRPTRP